MDIEEPFDYKIDDKINILNELEYFQLFFDDEIMNFFEQESNKYVTNILIKKYGSNFKEFILNEKAYNTYRYLYVTKRITKEDILAFIGVRIFMGINKLPSIENYWSNDVLYKNNLVKKVMSKEYYYFICFSLHFKDKNISENNEENIIDPRKKIQIFIEKLSSNFQKYYTLGKNITIDESLLHFTGRNKMKFYIPMKPHKWGFKIHLLCDSNTNYLYNMLFDPGKEGKDSIIYENNPSIAQSIVLRLLSCKNDG